MKVAASFALCFAGVLLAMMAWSSAAGPKPAQIAAKIAPEVLAETAGGGSASVVIMLADQADVSAANQMTDQDARGWFVYNTLTQHAARTQAGLRAELEARGVSYQSFWAANMIVATADRALIESLATREDVARIDSNREARWIEPPEIANMSAAPAVPNTVELGVTNINAPAVWALGFTGQGMVVGDQDTGQHWTHNALKPHYRGWNGTTADHNYNWHDAIHDSTGNACGNDSPFPCDDDTQSTHGTHTAGTTVGDDGAGNQIGVAPGAKWIGCRNMNNGDGTPARYTECFQFMIAPTDLSGNNANPTVRPHVLNNSWGCPASEGCTTRAELETIVNNTEAAGIFVVVSAGNSGPNCSTVTDAPAIYSASFSVGAYSASTNTLASFSSRGPSTFYTPNLLKPNISAPGVSVRSSQAFTDSSYGTLSGTSMAGPHVAGAVALLWSARPALVRDIPATKTLFQNTANPAITVTAQTCGGTPSTQIPNNSFGYGRIDVLAAYNASSSASPTPTPTPTPTATPTATPVSTATSTATATATASATATPTATVAPTATATATATSTATATATATPVTSPTATATPTATPATTPSATPTATATASATPAATPSATPTASAIATATATATAAPTATATATPVVTPSPTPRPAQATNLSTRLQVQTGDGLLIEGFIITGNSPKQVVLRALGPSLAGFGITNFVPDPVLQLRGSDGALIRQNDDWKDDQRSEIEGTVFEPSDDRESVIVATLTPGAYTALVTNKLGAPGIGTAEIYDADVAADAELANISTRGIVQTGNNVMIAGFTLGNPRPDQPPRCGLEARR